MVTYYDLVIRCPLCISAGLGSLPLRQWYHYNCGGKIQIGDNAHYRCLDCGHSSHMKNWRYGHDSC